MAKIEIQLECLSICPFGASCTQNLLENNSPCTESTQEFARALNESLSQEPILDPDRPQRQYSNIRFAANPDNEVTPIIAHVSNKNSAGMPTQRDDLPIGELYGGEIDIYDLNRQVLKRLNQQQAA